MNEIDEIFQYHTSAMQKAIIDVLTKLGYKVINSADLKTLLKTRGELVRRAGSKMVTLRIDGKEVLSWWETIIITEQNQILYGVPEFSVH